MAKIKCKLCGQEFEDESTIPDYTCDECLAELEEEEEIEDEEGND